nr:hypothetical protein [Tanacetum cinerariifolium]
STHPLDIYCVTIAENHREEEYQEGNNLPKIETLTYHVLATYRNVLVNGNWVGCSYKEFLACNPKEYDGKGGAVVLTRWIEKMENVQDMCGCSIDQKNDIHCWFIYWASHATYIDRFHELARLVMHLVTLESRMIERYMYGLAPQIHGMVAATEPTTIQKAIQISGALTDEVIRNGSIKRVEKRGNMGEPSKDRSGRDDNKRTRIGNVFLLGYRRFKTS